MACWICHSTQKEAQAVDTVGRASPMIHNASSWLLCVCVFDLKLFHRRDMCLFCFYVTSGPDKCTSYYGASGAQKDGDGRASKHPPLVQSHTE